MTTDNGFFGERREQSRVKATIVSKYFAAWAKVMIGVFDAGRGMREERIGYIDLFAGPGRYEDGSKSTPVMVLESAIQNEKMRQRLVTIFNDKEPSNGDSLQEAINSIPNVDSLRFKPKVHTQEVGEEIVKMFERMRLIPTFFFVDPWGYKGLSLRLVNSVLKDWGCDCVFFFNYNRINMGLSNPKVIEHMNALFGVERADALRERLISYGSHQRELLVVEELCQALRDLGPRYVLPFRFKDDNGRRTSHHLIFVSKGFKGYEIMKEIMAKESSSEEQGVASFEYNPVDAAHMGQQSFLYQLARPLDDLADMLLDSYAGRTLTMNEIYMEHNVDRRYIKRNYKDVLMKLEDAKLIQAAPHRNKTFGDNVMVKFFPKNTGY